MKPEELWVGDLWRSKLKLGFGTQCFFISLEYYNKDHKFISLVSKVTKSENKLVDIELLLTFANKSNLLIIEKRGDKKTNKQIKYFSFIDFFSDSGLAR